MRALNSASDGLQVISTFVFVLEGLNSICRICINDVKPIDISCVTIHLIGSLSKHDDDV